MEKEKFLGNKSVEKGTGVACGGAVKEIVCDWKLNNKCKAMNYDTCPINTGPQSGKAMATSPLR